MPRRWVWPGLARPGPAHRSAHSKRGSRCAAWARSASRWGSRIPTTSSRTSLTPYRLSALAAYTVLQLFEVAVATIILLLGVLSNSPPVALLGGGFLIGKAILNILWPEGGSVYRRSLIGYSVAFVIVLGGLIVKHFTG